MSDGDLSDRADANGDGRVDELDVIEVLRQLGVCDDDCPGDLDGDEIITDADLYELIRLWD
ncbi:MAG: hypothetical protein ACYTGC_19265 [Planctomycetota bacterium]